MSSAELPVFSTATQKKARSDSENSKVLMSSINTEKLKCSEKLSPNKVDSDTDPSIKRRPVEGYHSAPPKPASLEDSDFDSFHLSLQDQYQSEPAGILGASSMAGHFDPYPEFSEIEDARDSPVEERHGDIGYEDFTMKDWF